MIDFKKFFKAIGIINDQDQTKSLVITVDNTSTANTKVTLISKATQDRTIYLPDVDGTLATGVTVLTPDRAVITDNTGVVTTSDITSTEIEALDDISGNIQDQLDQITVDLSGLVVNTLAGGETDKAPSVNAVNAALASLDLTDYIKKDGTIPLDNAQSLKGNSNDTLTNYDLIQLTSGDAVRVGSYTIPTTVRGLVTDFRSAGNTYLGKNAANTGDVTISGISTTIEGWSGDGTSGNTLIRGNNGIILQTGLIKEIDVDNATIKNAINPIDPQDVATKDYVDNLIGGTPIALNTTRESLGPQVISSSSTNTLIGMNAVVDTASNWNAGSNSYSVDEGYYLVSGQVEWASGTGFSYIDWGNNPFNAFADSGFGETALNKINPVIYYFPSPTALRLKVNSTAGGTVIGSNHTYISVYKLSVSGGGGGGGSITGASNVGTGDGVFKDETSGTLNFKSLIAGAGVSITPGTDDITISTGSKVIFSGERNSGGTFSVTGGVQTKLPINAVIDTASGWNIGSDEYVVPTTGNYSLSGGMATDTDFTSGILGIYVNGNLITGAAGLASQSASIPSKVVTLTAADVVTLELTSTSGILVQQSPATFMSIYQI